MFVKLFFNIKLTVAFPPDSKDLGEIVHLTQKNKKKKKKKIRKHYIFKQILSKFSIRQIYQFVRDAFGVHMNYIVNVGIDTTCEHFYLRPALREKSPYSELFWSTFSRIRTEYGEILFVFGPNTGKCRPE